MKAVFTDRELEYIYSYLDIDVNRVLYAKIEKKIRKQIKRYKDFDKNKRKKGAKCHNTQKTS